MTNKLIGCVGHDCPDCKKLARLKRAAMRWYRSWDDTGRTAWTVTDLALFRACKALDKKEHPK